MSATVGGDILSIMQTLTVEQIEAAGLPDWAPDSGAMHAKFATGSFAAGLEFVTAVAAVAEAANHHPDVTLTYPTVGITLTTHEASGVTHLDLALAEQISAIARDRGIAVR